MTNPMQSAYARRGKRWIALHAVYTVAISVSCVWDLVLIWRPAFHTGNITWVLQLGRTGWRTFLWLILWYACLYAVNAANLLRQTRRLLGPAPRRQTVIMKRLALISRHSMLIRGGRFLNIFSGIFGVLLFMVTHDLRVLSLAALLLSLWFWLRTRITTPPVLLLLAASDHESVRRHWVYKRFTAPLRVLSLLDTTGRAEPGITNELELDCVRTQNDDDWWSVIQVLVEYSPFIAIDTRAATAGVLREFRYLLDQQLDCKTIFLLGPSGECPLLETPDCPSTVPPSELCLVDDRAALRILDRFLFRGEIPSPERPFGQICPPEITVRIFQNPYKMIMTKCPVSGAPVKTGINSSYFALWKDNPPEGGAEFICPECGAKHTFGKNDTWLEDIGNL